MIHTIEYLKAHHYPQTPKLQVLCMNCQFIKEYETHQWSEIGDSRPRQEPLTMTPATKTRQQLTTKAPKQRTMKAPELVTHDFPYLDKRDLPENGRRIGTIIRPPQITETKWGTAYRFAVQSENGERRRWSMNKTTYNNLLSEFGKNESNWIGKSVSFRTQQFPIHVENKVKYITGIMGEPVK